MEYDAWVKTVPKAITEDSLWKMRVYRLALFLADLAWHDVTRLMEDRQMLALADQLYRAIGSISSNTAEGYSRGTGKDRARFCEYALGSARESRDWYFKGRHVLGDAIVRSRMELIAEIIRLLLTMVPQRRQYTLQEEGVSYDTMEP